MGVVGALLVLGYLGVITYRTSTYDAESRYRAEASEQDTAQTEQSDEPLRCVYIATLDEFEDCIAEQVERSAEQEHNRADLHAQRQMAKYTYGLYLTGLAAFLVSAVGLGALFYTFNEQRKLTKAENRAVLEVLGASIYYDANTTIFGVRMHVFNSGHTLAREIQGIGAYEYEPELVEGKPISEPDRRSFKDRLPSISAKATERFLSIGYLSKAMKPLLDPEARKIHIGTESCEPARLWMRGTLSYFDVYGDRQETTFALSVTHLIEGQAVRMDGSRYDWEPPEMRKETEASKD